MKIPRRPKEVKAADPAIWEKLTDFINDPGNWEQSGQHSHNVTDPGHSHGSHSHSIPEITRSSASSPGVESGAAPN